MKINGFHASTSGGQKVMAVSLILALVLASISVVAALAAPGAKSTSAFGSQMRELNFDRAWFNSAKLDAANFVRTSDPVKAQQYLSQYAFALNQADAIVAGHGTATNNQSNNNNQSNGSNASNNSGFGSAQSQLGQWLHIMRGLQGKLADLGFTASVGNTTNNVAGSGVPVTGGTTSNNGTSNSGTSNNGTSSSSAATPTATPGTGTGSSSSSGTGSSTTPTATPGTGSSSNSGTGTSSNSGTGASSNSNNGTAGIPNTGSQSSTFLSANRKNLMKVWGPQFSELEFDMVWFNNFKSNPKNFSSTDPARTQQWMDQYAFALRQAQALLASRGLNTMNNNNNQSNSSISNNSGFGSTQSQMGQWLHMMSGLRAKLSSMSNNTSSSSTGSGSSTTP